MSRRVAVLTGATGGIGSAILHALILDGYQVIACGRDVLKLQRLAEQYGANVTPWPLDFHAITQVSLGEQTLEVLQPWDCKVDLLVCAHGVIPGRILPTILVPSSDISPVYDVDVLGTFIMAQAIGGYMLAQGHGSIVLLSSLHARTTYPRRAAYCMAKASVVALARALAVEWGPYNIRVNSVSPWQVSGERTDMFIAKQLEDTGEDLLSLYIEKSPLRRIVTPEDIAKTVLFLAENTSLTGQDIVLDCGVTASMWFRPFGDTQ